MTQLSQIIPPEISSLPTAEVPEHCHSAGVAAENVWRDGMMFVIAPDSVLPARCLKCNAESGGLPSSKKISTLSAWYPLFSSAGWNSDSIHDRPIHICFGLCPRHRLQRMGRHALVGLVGLMNVFGFLIYGKPTALSPITDILAVVLPLLLVVMSLSFRPILRPRRVHHGLAWFAGAGPEFLNSLPELSARTTVNPSSP
ncbi:MAG TPA: hypothetical protein VHX86_01680 [Tepidisphaeraceae bacterium]|jgi:hypothetical protein|nr:hypothetical protein [Tepidisphaeraceae bacterium]